MSSAPEPTRPSIFDAVPEEPWEEPDDDPGDVMPLQAVDLEILSPIHRDEG
ncbi:hypothetical protein [Demequina soli]|uniref:hypothetical protein n=1 Tax=Demequina soli TaxID=1638987 RepID=UPI0012DFEC99|nr:hypothetical protein [Demequina soli]